MTDQKPRKPRNPMSDLTVGKSALASMKADLARETARADMVKAALLDGIEALAKAEAELASMKAERDQFSEALYVVERRLSALAPLVEAARQLSAATRNGHHSENRLIASDGVADAFDALQNPAAPVSRCAHMSLAGERCLLGVTANGHCDMHQSDVAPTVAVPAEPRDGLPRATGESLAETVAGRRAIHEPPTDRDRRIVAAAEAWRLADEDQDTTPRSMTLFVHDLRVAVDLPKSAGATGFRYTLRETLGEPERKAVLGYGSPADSVAQDRAREFERGRSEGWQACLAAALREHVLSRSVLPYEPA